MEDEEELLLAGAVKRQEERVRQNTYLHMKDSLRGLEAISHEKRKERDREPFLSAIDKSNEALEKNILRFTASSLPASSYIR